MAVPASQNRLFDSLRATLAACATFRRLVDADSPAEAHASIYDRFVRDEYAPDTDMTDKTRQPLDPYPRAVLVDGEVSTRIEGQLSLSGGGQMGIFLEFKQFSAEELTAWYGVDVGTPTESDHLVHADNLRVALRNEILDVSREADLLTITRLVDQSMGMLDPKQRGNLDVWVIAFLIDWEGLP